MLVSGCRVELVLLVTAANRISWCGADRIILTAVVADISSMARISNPTLAVFFLLIILQQASSLFYSHTQTMTINNYQVAELLHSSL